MHLGLRERLALITKFVLVFDSQQQQQQQQKQQQQQIFDCYSS